ncbi:MAG: valine--tRNA ligase [Candidatus Pacebacteria bacterium]|nr:valine--tRNA ligase [Candidatus Paceibacterota bacterium]
MPYDHSNVEGRIYEFWEKNGYFKPDFSKKGKPFSIIMPPPNANAPLHIGHAVFITIEDILIRFFRMQKRPVLWLPGFDHAGFETWYVFQKKIEKEGRDIFQENPQKIYDEIFKFTQKNRDISREQLKKVGASADWSREKFTLDKDIIEIVYQTFEKFYRDGLIYRGKRIINWCPYHKTSLSDLEVVYKEEEGWLWYIKYPFKQTIKTKNGQKIDHITVATTRPETMLGDRAVAVNPKDKRYKDFIGQKVILPILDREIPVIGDEAVDINFGTGAVKITPAHDPLDFEIAQRNNLGAIQVIGFDGKMTKEAGSDFEGLAVKEVRREIILKLKQLGLLEKKEIYKHSIGHCYKCNSIIQPQLSDQWFIKMEPLAKKAIEVIKKNKIKFYPAYQKNILLNWLSNIKDWNISRQIIWGIRIPVWYCQKQGSALCRKKNGIIISNKKPKECPYCKSKDLIAETDVFDTWFSSAQWPFATLMTSSQGGADFKKFYPTSVMETAYDILFFWVARMIMVDIYITGEIPFFDVYLHGLVRDKDRQKMSKSKGNVIDPLGVVDQYGADALRMALVFGTGVGRDIIISEEKIKSQRNFTNKIFNAGNFVLMNLGDNFDPKKINPKLTKEDKLILDKTKKVKAELKKDIKNYKFHEAAQKIYQFFWHQFCDKTIEDCKKRIYRAQNENEKDTPRFVLWTVLYESLKMLHPFMPFITEDIYQKLPSKPKDALIIEEW